MDRLTFLQMKVQGLVSGDFAGLRLPVVAAAYAARRTTSSGRRRKTDLDLIEVERCDLSGFFSKWRQVMPLPAGFISYGHSIDKARSLCDKARSYQSRQFHADMPLFRSYFVWEITDATKLAPSTSSTVLVVERSSDRWGRAT